MVVDRQTILDEIRRCAEANDGGPLGRERFSADAGITKSDWLGRYWRLRSDAVREARFQPNSWNSAHPDEHLLLKLAELTCDLGRMPTEAE